MYRDPEYPPPQKKPEDYLTKVTNELSQAILNYNPNSQRRYNSFGTGHIPDDKEKIATLIKKNILSKGLNINDTNLFWDTLRKKPHPNIDILQLLISYGADVNKVDRDITPVDYALSELNIGLLKFLIDNGARFDMRKPIMNPRLKNKRDIRDEFKYVNLVTYALICGNVELLELLIIKGADFNVNKPDYNYGDIPIRYAIQGNFVDLLKFLIDNGADVNLVEHVRGNTPLFYTTNVTDPRIIRLLLKNGADVNHRNDNGLTPLDINPRLAQLNREVQAEQNFEVRKPLLQLSEGTQESPSPRTRYLQNELVARDISSYLDRNTKGGKHKKNKSKKRKSRKSMKYHNRR
jgi:ankyrin repeat protein